MVRRPRKNRTGIRLASFRRGLLQWYAAYGRKFPWRKTTASLYIKILSEILLQRTRAETVAAFLPAFTIRFSSWSSIASARRGEIARHLKPIGLWRQRSKSLVKLATVLASRNGRFPRTRNEIESLPGVGQYIANAVLLFCYAEPQPLLDVNMARVLERYFGPRRLADIRYDPDLQFLALSVVRCENPVTLNWALLDLATLVCRPKRPLCAQCPVSRGCRFPPG